MHRVGGDRVTRDFIDRLELVTVYPRALHTWAKLIDNYPGRGTFPIMGPRIVMYAGLRMRQLYYEPLTSLDSVYAAAGLLELEYALALPEGVGSRISIAFPVFPSARDAPAGRLEAPGPGEQGEGHSVRVLARAPDGDGLLFVNSWGRTWGNHGMGIASATYLERFLSEAWIARNVRYGPSPSKTQLVPGRSIQQLRALWMVDNRRWRTPVDVRGRRRMLVLYESISIDRDIPVEVVELRGDGFIRLGWAFVLHDRAASMSFVRELFVWPPYRRRGYGSELEAVVADRSAAWGSRSVEIPLYEADAIPRAGGAGRRFLIDRGYQLHWRRSSMPRAVAVATKSI